MADATDSTCTPNGQPSAAPGVLPYRDLDILGDGRANYIAGNALLAEITRGWAEDRREAGALDEAAKEALVKVAVAEEDDQLCQLSSPSQDLAGVIVKLAYALRAGNWAMHGNGTYADASLAIMGTALSDLILLREAEARRRSRLGESRP